MTMPPTFSILMPVYNHEDYVREALDSVLAQTDPDWEAIVIDDGSTDGTGAVVDDYATRDARIRVFHQENGGQGRALNAALRRATGEWICWLSSDDLFKPDKLATHRRYFEEDPDCRFFFTAFDVLQEDTGTVEDGPAEFNAPPESRWRLLRLLSHNYINGITICVHRAVFEAVGEFEPRYRYAQDYDLYMRIMRSNRARFLEERTCVKRRHAEQWAVVKRLAMFYQCSEAAIRFLNTCSFEELFPGVDLGAPGCALSAVEQALDIALSPHAYVNQLGVHTALLGRIVEWLTPPSGQAARQACRLVLWDLREAAEAAAGSFKSGVCRAACVAVLSGGASAYVPVSPEAVARGTLSRTSPESGEAAELRSFLDCLGADGDVVCAGAPGRACRTVLAVGDFEDAGSRDAPRVLAAEGCCVIRMTSEGQPFAVDGNLVSVRGEGGLGDSLACAAAGPFDAVVGAKRIPWLLRASASAVAVLDDESPGKLSEMLARAAAAGTAGPRFVPALARLCQRLRGKS